MDDGVKDVVACDLLDERGEHYQNAGNWLIEDHTLLSIHSVAYSHSAARVCLAATVAGSGVSVRLDLSPQQALDCAQALKMAGLRASAVQAQRKHPAAATKAPL